jgi:Class III cytochrome C family
MKWWVIIITAMIAIYCLAAAPATQRAPPGMIVLDQLVGQYDPVPFDHKTHAAMAQMWDGCTTCHHRKPKPTTLPAAHVTQATKQQSDAADVPACRSCHEVNPAKPDLRLPSLKGAYHRQCLNCHRDWADENSCDVCHRPRDGKSKRPATPSADDIVGRMHPPIAEPDVKVYRARFIPAVGANVTFRHKEHTATYGLQCVVCHRRDNCADCHNGKISTIAHKPLMPGRTWQDSHAPCIGCHQQNTCRHCHYDDGKSAPPVFSHRTTGQVLDKDHESLKCGQCHGKLRSKVGMTCGDASCHRSDPTIAFPANRPGPVVTTRPAVAASPTSRPTTRPTTRAVIQRIRT